MEYKINQKETSSQNLETKKMDMSRNESSNEPSIFNEEKDSIRMEK